MVQSKQTCEQDFTNGILNSAECKETHNAAGGGGVEHVSENAHAVLSTANALIKLTSIKQGNSDILKKLPSINSSKVTSIFFDHHTKTLQSEAKVKVQEILTTLCNEISSAGTLSSEVPTIFIELQEVIGRTSANDLLTIYNSLKEDSLNANCGIKRLKFYLDAAAMSASTESIIFLANLIGKGEQLEEKPKSLFSFYLSFSQNPEENALKAILPMIQVSKPDLKLVLGSSGLAHQFCLTNITTCTINEYYTNLVDSIVKIVEDNYKNTDIQAQQLTITALEALGNLDVLTNKAIAILNTILTSNDNSIRLKNHALQAFRRDSCQEKLKLATRKLLDDVNLSSDIRIHAYLALTRCLSGRDVTLIASMLRKEKVDQGKLVTYVLPNHLLRLIG